MGADLLETAQSVSARRRSERRKWLLAVLASVVLHLIIFVGAGDRPLPRLAESAAGPSASDSRAAKGSMQVLTMRVPPPIPRVIPRPVINVEVEIEPIEFEEPYVLEPPPSFGEGESEGEGPGMEDGEGEGDGGESTEGRTREVAPNPIFFPMVPSYDGNLEERIQVWVWVDIEGSVVPDSTRLNPPTRDRDFNRRMIEEANTWLFVPAERGGVPVATWFRWTASIGS